MKNTLFIAIAILATSLMATNSYAIETWAYTSTFENMPSGLYQDQPGDNFAISNIALGGTVGFEFLDLGHVSGYIPYPNPNVTIPTGYHIGIAIYASNVSHIVGTEEGGNDIWMSPGLQNSLSFVQSTFYSNHAYYDFEVIASGGFLWQGSWTIDLPYPLEVNSAKMANLDSTAGGIPLYESQGAIGQTGSPPVAEPSTILMSIFGFLPVAFRWMRRRFL